MKNLFFVLSIMILFNSCGVIEKDVDYERKFYDDVPLNKNISKELGDKLITKGQQDYQKAFKIVNVPSFKINRDEYPYEAGDVLPLVAETKHYFLYYDKEKTGSLGNYLGIAQNKDTDEIRAFVKSDLSFYTKYIPDFEVTETIFTNSNCRDCFKQEFVYNGRVDNNLRFIYREYINDMARPAFNQELQYDLNESNIIGFKGLRIEIVDATNTQIDYIVLSSFN